MLLAVAAIVSPAMPVSIDDLGGILVVPATVNGRGPYHFVLDTGAGITVITPDLAKDLDVQPKGNDTITGMGEKQTAIQTLILDRVAVGNAAQANVTAAIIPLPTSLTNQGSYGEIDGILGYSFFKSYALTLNIAQKTATFASEADFAPPPATTPVPFELAEQSIPFVYAGVDGERGRFEIDSGNNGTMIVTKAFSEEHKIARRYASGRSSQYTGVGGTIHTRQVRIGSVSVGDATLHNVAADISPAKGSALQQDHLDGTIGYDVLSRFVVTLDYPRSRLFLQPLYDFDAYRPETGTGMVVERAASGDFVVTDVVEGSPAARAGVSAGSTIVAIDGLPAATLSAGGYRDAIGRVPGNRVTYRLETSDRSRREVTLTTVDMLPPKDTP